MTWLSSWLNEHDELSLSQFARGTGFNKGTIAKAAQTGVFPSAGASGDIESDLIRACVYFEKTGELLNVKLSRLRNGEAAALGRGAEIANAIHESEVLAHGGYLSERYRDILQDYPTRAGARVEYNITR